MPPPNVAVLAPWRKWNSAECVLPGICSRLESWRFVLSYQPRASSRESSKVSLKKIVWDLRVAGQATVRMMKKDWINLFILPCSFNQSKTEKFREESGRMRVL
jgi:hypothetical protein